MSALLAVPVKSARDVRLDFFRGLAMFIIFIAHVPDNFWFRFIPARFGFSSAAELFVFCSGLASSLAFGRVFVREGWLAGTRRVLHRLWQVYWAHIGLALVLMGVSVAALKLTGIDYPERLMLGWFFGAGGDGLFQLLTLRFMPTFLDILPMYLVLLAMIPVMMALGTLHHLAPLLAMIAMWLLVQIAGVNLPGGPMPGGEWFFNPFAWQLVFFTGFAFGIGWLKAPALARGWLFRLCVIFLVLSVPVNFWAFTDHVAVLAGIHILLVPEIGKTNLVLPLYVHFLASAYVVLVLVERHREMLARLKPIVLVGQQALATFMASIILAWIAGMVLDQIGRSIVAVSVINLAGFAGLIAVAMVARDYKGGGKGPSKTTRSEASTTGEASVPRAAISPAE